MKRLVLPSIRTLSALLAAGLMVYYFLLHNNVMHASIYDIITYAHTLPISIHLIILGLLPVYISVVVFGAAVLGLYLNSRIEL